MTTAFLIAALVGALALACYSARAVLFLTAQQAILKTKPNGAETPAGLGLEYEDFRIESGARRLQAWWVKAAPGNDLHKAVMICHGNNESISDWVPVYEE